MLDKPLCNGGGMDDSSYVVVYACVRVLAFMCAFSWVRLYCVNALCLIYDAKRYSLKSIPSIHKINEQSTEDII